MIPSKMKTSDNTIIKVVIPRWVEKELKGIDIVKVLTDYCTPPTPKQIACVKCLTDKCKDCDNDKEEIKLPYKFEDLPEHEVKKTGIPTKHDELIFASELERIKPKKDMRKFLDKITSEPSHDPCEGCQFTSATGCTSSDNFCVDTL